MSCVQSISTCTRLQARLSISLQRRFLSQSANIINSSFTSVEIPNLTIPQYVFENFHQYPDKIGVECAASGRKYTFEEIRAKSTNLGKALRKIWNLENGDVVAILLPNVPEFPICVLGCLEAGLTVTTINPTYTPGEIKSQLLDSGAKTIITLSGINPLANAATNGIARKIPIINIKQQESETLPGDAINFNELINTNFTPEINVPSTDVNSTAFLLYSSGTTGLPKGVKLSHRNIVANLCQISHPLLKIAADTTDTHQDVIPGILPWFHVGGLNPVMLLYLRYLCKLVPLPKFTPELFMSTICKHRPHLMVIVPPIASFISNSPVIKREHLLSIRAIVCGAAPLGALDEERLLQKADGNFNVLQAYGLTETSPFVLATSSIRKKAIGFKGSVGEALPNTLLKVVPADDLMNKESLGPNEPGELLVKGPQVTEGYHNNPDETKNAFVDGWLRTGDLVYYDQNKMFYVQDRLKELIKVKGYQVAPAELEELIRCYPDVSDVAVIGVPNERYGEVPHAYVAVKPNALLDANGLLNYVSNKVAEYKTLRGGITIIDSIPKNASGKIMRRQLKLHHPAAD